MSNISEFKAQMTSGGARPNQFRVFITFPAGVNNASLVGQKLQFLCKTASLPASKVGDTEIKYRGRQVHFAGERDFQPWEVTVYCDNDFVVREAFENWAFAIQSTDSTSGTQSPSAYQVDMTVQQLDRMDRVVKEYTFHDAWPSEIGNIALDWDQNNSIETFNVTFTYNFWTSNGVSNRVLDQ